MREMIKRNVLSHTWLGVSLELIGSVGQYDYWGRLLTELSCWSINRYFCDNTLHKLGPLPVTLMFSMLVHHRAYGTGMAGWSALIRGDVHAQPWRRNDQKKRSGLQAQWPLDSPDKGTAMPPGVEKSSATTILTLLYKRIHVLHTEEFQLPPPPQYWEMIETANIFYVSWIHSAQRGLSLSANTPFRNQSSCSPMLVYLKTRIVCLISWSWFNDHQIGQSSHAIKYVLYMNKIVL